MFIRFVSNKIDKQSKSLQGVFRAVWELRADNLLERHEEKVVLPALLWLSMHLKVPPCLADPENYRAICWFKETAKEPLKRIWIVVNVLEEHNINIELLKSKDPGIVIYEDGWQVVAKPYKNRK